MSVPRRGPSRAGDEAGRVAVQYEDDHYLPGLAHEAGRTVVIQPPSIEAR
jgi:hypothetical protein